LALRSLPQAAGSMQTAGYNQDRVKILLISSDPRVRDSMAVIMRSVKRSTGEEPEFLEARDGIRGLTLAWRHLPQVVVADEIASRAGAFAVARELKTAASPFPGRVIIFLDRRQDEWLARWSGADAWFVKPVNPFEIADTMTGFLGDDEREAV
jgi:DNA-binding response OmpR family regulator